MSWKLLPTGYYRGEAILVCDETGITTYLPKSQTSGNQAKGLFGKRDFIYRPDDDEYTCPAGERLIYRFTREENGKQIRRYWSSACPRCAMKSQCTTADYRRVSRWEHEAVLEAVQERLDREPERMRARRETVEHPFGSIKSWTSSSHFLMRRLEHVGTEMCLQVLAYDLKRVMQILGPSTLVAAIGPRRSQEWTHLRSREVIRAGPRRLDRDRNLINASARPSGPGNRVITHSLDPRRTSFTFSVAREMATNTTERSRVAET
jgi:hypothetical protein